MRVTEKLLQDNNKNKNKQEKEPEVVEMYMERKKTTESINRRKSVFQSKYNEGINTSQSVFDRQAIFKTNSDLY